VFAGLLWKLLFSFARVAYDLAGHVLVVGRFGGISQPSGVEQPEAEPLVNPVAGGIHAPAGIVTER